MYEPVDEDQRAVLDLIMRGKMIDYSDINVCNTILEASLNWTDTDEVNHPMLKAARMRAQYQVTSYEKTRSDYGTW